ncbi:hypothetical protein I317_06360, partial [Kwoniella heveanensis CBS 569]
MSSTTTTTATAAIDARKRPRQSSIDSNNRDTKRRKDGSKKATSGSGELGKGKSGSNASGGDAGGKKEKTTKAKDEGKSWVTSQIESMEKLYKEVLVQAAMIFQHQAFSNGLGLQDKVPLHMMHRLEITWRTYEALRRQTEQCMAQSGQTTSTNASSSLSTNHAKLVPSLHTKPTSTSTLSALSALATSGTPPKTIDLPIPAHLAINLDNLRSASPIPVPVVVEADSISALEQATTAMPASVPATGESIAGWTQNIAGEQAQQSQQPLDQQVYDPTGAQGQTGQIQGTESGVVKNAGQGEGALQDIGQNGAASNVPLPHSHPLSTDSTVQLPPVQPQVEAQVPHSAMQQPIPQPQPQQVPIETQTQSQATNQAGPVMDPQGDVDYSALGLAELTALINGDSFDPLSMGLSIPDSNQQAQAGPQLQLQQM